MREGRGERRVHSGGGEQEKRPTAAEWMDANSDQGSQLSETKDGWVPPEDELGPQQRASCSAKRFHSEPPPGIEVKWSMPGDSSR